MSEHEFARFLVVAALENPEETLIKKDLYELTLDTEYLISETRELRRAQATLKVLLGALASLLLSRIGNMTPHEADELIEEVFDFIGNAGGD